MQPYASTGGVVRSGPHNLLNDADDSLPARGPITVRPIAAGDYIFGLGMFNVGGDDTLRLSFYTAGGDLITSVVSAAAFGFFGIVDDTGAAYATVDFVGGNGYAPTDDWQAATRTTFIPEPPIAPVPLPAGLPLLAAGLGALGALRLRRQANSLPGPKSS
ncbi:VPLPA-CTERM sorting domain-containing protein [Frigidibacter sp. MR17.14]|uniref:VPLPA-CTERM sorting domain-containing protein n=1 Tax=Frigidibacter sp. MR17.14 TaxID=3126509 RepID=UPI003012E00E